MIVGYHNLLTRKLMGPKDIIIHKTFIAVEVMIGKLHKLKGGVRAIDKLEIMFAKPGF